MFDQIDGPKKLPDIKKRTDYSGLKIVCLIAPVFMVFVYLDNVDMGLAVSIILGMALLAIKIYWDLRKYVWFWMTIGIILALNFYLLIRVPQRWIAALGPLHAAGLLPIGFADLSIFLGAIWIAERCFLKEPPSA